MKNITFIAFVALLMVSVSAFAQVTGTVVDGETNTPLPGVNIIEVGTTNGASTDFDGKFTINTQTSNGSLEISYVGFATKTVTFSGKQNLGTIVLDLDNSLDEIIIVGSGVIDLAEGRKTPIAVSTVKAEEIREKASGNVELPEIIKSTPSVFVSNQTGFGDSSLFLRGFDDTNTAILLNGQPVNSVEDGRVFWSNWAGLSDIANAVQVQRGLGSSKLAISSVGGTVNIVMKAADRNKGGSFRLLGGNDSYAKATFSYDTGMNEKGWAFSMLVDHWQAHRKWAEGTFGSGQNYFFSVGYKPNEQHNFNFLITGAPQSHGQRWSQSESTLIANPKYNQHWGYTESLNENGQYTSEIDSERRNFYHKPVMNINWDWDISEKSELSSVLYASWGRGGGTGPRGRGRIRTADPDNNAGDQVGQIDYAAIEARNQGTVGQGDRDGDSYARRSSVNNHQWYGLISNFNTELTETVSWNVGADFRWYRGDHFRQIADLYGHTGWANDRPDGAVVTETYDADPWAALFNFADEDQRIDYDYSENINYQGVFSQIEFANDALSAFFQGALSNQSYVREGRFEGQGLGDSDKLNKIGYNLKGGFGINLDEENTLFFNGGFYSRQPFLDNVFQNIRNSDVLVQPEVDNEEITGLEVGYKLSTGDVRFNVNAYYTDWSNRVILSNGTRNQDTPQEINVNIFERGVRQLHTGLEMDLDFRVSDAVTVKMYGSVGNWEFRDTADVEVYNDDTNELIESSPGSNRDGVKVPRAAQTTAGLSIKARLAQGLTLDGGINYFADNWIRSREDAQTENIGKIDPFSLTDIGLSYDFMLGENKMNFRANVFNIFNETSIQQSDAFGFFNNNGTTFNGSLRYNF